MHGTHPSVIERLLEKTFPSSPVDFPTNAAAAPNICKYRPQTEFAGAQSVINRPMAATRHHAAVHEVLASGSRNSTQLTCFRRRAINEFDGIIGAERFLRVLGNDRRETLIWSRVRGNDSRHHVGNWMTGQIITRLSMQNFRNRATVALPGIEAIN